MGKRGMLAIAGVVLMAGCGNLGDTVANAPTSTAPKAKLPYHLDFETKAVKPNPAGVAIPAITYTGNPKALERRAALVVKFDGSGIKNDQPNKDTLVMDPVDIPGTGGTLPGNYMDAADQKLSKLLAGYCFKGTAKVSVVLVRSSIKPEPNAAEVEAKRLSDWVPAELVFKNPHPKC